MFKEELFKTTINGEKKAIDFTKEIVIRKSSAANIFTALLATGCLAVIVYRSFAKGYEFGIINIIFLAGSSLFAFFSIKGLFSNSGVIKINSSGIILSEWELIKWSEIKTTYIRRRAYYFTRGGTPTIERFFLNIETTYSGRFSKKPGMRAYEITGLELSETEISELVECYRQKFSLL